MPAPVRLSQLLSPPCPPFFDRRGFAGSRICRQEPITRNPAGAVFRDVPRPPTTPPAPSPSAAAGFSVARARLSSAPGLFVVSLSVRRVVALPSSPLRRPFASPSPPCRLRLRLAVSASPSSPRALDAPLDALDGFDRALRGALHRLLDAPLGGLANALHRPLGAPLDGHDRALWGALDAPLDAPLAGLDRAL